MGSSTADTPTILIVDDEYLLRQVLQDVLEFEGYQVQGVANGQVALDYLQGAEQLPQLILADILMPEINGYELLQQTRGLLPEIKIPFVFISGQEATMIFDQPTPEGVFGYVSKPFEVAVLLKIVRHALNYA